MLLFAATHIVGAPQPANIFANHMVLQRERPVPVWGKASQNTLITVEFSGQTVKTKTNDAGQWRVELAPLKTNSTGRDMTIRDGNDRHVIRDVLVGEVWFAGGQSNMAYTSGAMAKKFQAGKDLVSAANYPAIRFRKINERNAPEPRTDLSNADDWLVCSPKAVLRQSAVAFVFARRIHLATGVPIGIIDCSWGGTPIEPYIPASAFVGHPTLVKLAALAKTNDIEAIKALPGGTFARSDAWLAGAIYNGRIAPVTPYAIRGAIWYQGESNSGRGEDPRDYAHKMRALIKGWRQAFQNMNMPVYFVQLPQWKSYAWTYLREGQRKSLDMPNTGMAVTIDLDNANDIHPPNKVNVGERLALWPLVKQYKQGTITSGPLFKSATFNDGKATVTFDHADNGLMPGKQNGTAIETVNDEQLHGFELADTKGKWHEANAVIKDETILIVTSTQVKKPVAVRYACHPTAPKNKPWNLYNKAGLPASPFCSDWKLMPYDVKQNPMPK